MLRQIYYEAVPDEVRLWFYKLRHPRAIRQLRNQINLSPKGNFSLRAFDSNKCIFVHITKTAGTSVAKSLFGQLPYHYRAVEYRVIFGRKDFARYFKFAFVRNPWDRLYSAYSYLKGGGWDREDEEWFRSNLSGLPDFTSFVMDWLTPDRLRSHIHFRPQCEFICDRRGHPLIDQLGYFESIDTDFSSVSKRLGLSNKLIRTNESERLDYHNAYTADSIEKVARLYAQDITNLGYAFDCLHQRMLIQNRRFVRN